MLARLLGVLRLAPPGTNSCARTWCSSPGGADRPLPGRPHARRTLMDEGVFTQEEFSAAQAQALKQTGWQPREATPSPASPSSRRAIWRPSRRPPPRSPSRCRRAKNPPTARRSTRLWRRTGLCARITTPEPEHRSGGGRLVVEPDYLYSWQIITFLRYADYSLSSEAAALEEKLRAFVSQAVTADMTDSQKGGSP
jgi:hypothetical protein